MAMPSRAAAAETPPPTPTTSIVCSGFSPDRSIMRRAVAVASPNDPATSQGIDPGLRTALIVGITIFSVNVPGRCSPRIWNESQ